MQIVRSMASRTCLMSDHLKRGNEGPGREEQKYLNAGESDIGHRKATLKPMDSNRRVEEKHQLQQQLLQQPVAARQEVALSEFSTGNEDPFYSMDASDDLNSTSKIPWKIRAARKRAMKGHTTGMTKEEFAKIKQSLMQSSANCKF